MSTPSYYIVSWPGIRRLIDKSSGIGTVYSEKNQEECPEIKGSNLLQTFLPDMVAP
jgi:hypothetical protein